MRARLEMQMHKRGHYPNIADYGNAQFSVLPLRKRLAGDVLLSLVFFRVPRLART